MSGLNNNDKLTIKIAKGLGITVPEDLRCQVSGQPRKGDYIDYLKNKGKKVDELNEKTISVLQGMIEKGVLEAEVAKITSPGSCPPPLSQGQYLPGMDFDSMFYGAASDQETAAAAADAADAAAAAAAAAPTAAALPSAAAAASRKRERDPAEDMKPKYRIPEDSLTIDERVLLVSSYEEAMRRGSEGRKLAEAIIARTAEAWEKDVHVLCTEEQCPPSKRAREDMKDAPAHKELLQNYEKHGAVPYDYLEGETALQIQRMVASESFAGTRVEHPLGRGTRAFALTIVAGLVYGGGPPVVALLENIGFTADMTAITSLIVDIVGTVSGGAATTLSTAAEAGLPAFTSALQNIGALAPPAARATATLATFNILRSGDIGKSFLDLASNIALGIQSSAKIAKTTLAVPSQCKAKLFNLLTTVKARIMATVIKTTEGFDSYINSLAARITRADEDGTTQRRIGQWTKRLIAHDWEGKAIPKKQIEEWMKRHVKEIPEAGAAEKAAAAAEKAAAAAAAAAPPPADPAAPPAPPADDSPDPAAGALTDDGESAGVIAQGMLDRAGTAPTSGDGAQLEEAKCPGDSDAASRQTSTIAIPARPPALPAPGQGGGRRRTRRRKNNKKRMTRKGGKPKRKLAKRPRKHHAKKATRKGKHVRKNKYNRKLTRKYRRR